MLTITAQQSLAFDREQRYQLALRLLPRLQHELPEQWPATTTSDAYHHLVGKTMVAITAAIDHGFEDDDEIARFLELSSLVDNLGASDTHDNAIALLDSETIATGWPETRGVLVALCQGGIVDASSEPAR